MKRVANISPTNEPAPRSPATVSPVGRVPGVLAWLFPSLGDQSDNPVYIRLSGQGYGRRGAARWFWGPPEFRQGSLIWSVLTRPGFWPVFLIPFDVAALLLFVWRATRGPQAPQGPPQFPPAWNSAFLLTLGAHAWIFLFIAMRMALGRTRHWAAHFYWRSRLEGWGEDLILSGMTPESVRRAIFAAAAPRLARRVFGLGACGFALMIGTIGQSDAGYMLVALIYWIDTWIFFTGLELLDLAEALRGSSLLPPEPADVANAKPGADAKPAWGQRLRRFATPPAAAVLMMLPAIFIQYAAGLFTPILYKLDPGEIAPHVTVAFFNVLLTCNFFRMWIDRRFLRRAINHAEPGP